jgi:hypothetical protein
MVAGSHRHELRSLQALTAETRQVFGKVGREGCISQKILRHNMV